MDETHDPQRQDRYDSPSLAPSQAPGRPAGERGGHTVQPWEQGEPMPSVRDAHAQDPGGSAPSSSAGHSVSTASASDDEARRGQAGSPAGEPPEVQRGGVLDAHSNSVPLAQTGTGKPMVADAASRLQADPRFGTEGAVTRPSPDLSHRMPPYADERSGLAGSPSSLHAPASGAAATLPRERELAGAPDVPGMRGTGLSSPSDGEEEGVGGGPAADGSSFDALPDHAQVAGGKNVGGNLAAAQRAGDKVGSPSRGDEVGSQSRLAGGRTPNRAGGLGGVPGAATRTVTGRPDRPAAGAGLGPESGGVGMRASDTGLLSEPSATGRATTYDNDLARRDASGIDAAALVDAVCEAVAENLARALRQSVVEAVDAALDRAMGRTALGEAEKPVTPRFIMGEPLGNGSRAA